jgi:large subunit ribosomal protein L4
MTIDVYTSAGQKKGTLALPPSLFESIINKGLIHQAVIMQQSNRRGPIAHAKTRGEVVGSTKKMFAQKGTGRARRGPIRSPLLRGGGKAFGPRNDSNFIKNMPKNMRHAALRACLSLQAKQGAIIGLESYPETIKTKTMTELLKKMPVEMGRRILFVIPGKHEALWLSSRNIPRTKVVMASYLNPEDIVNAKHVIFLGGAIEKADEVFGSKKEKKISDSSETASEETPKKTAARKTTKKPAAKKASSSSK